VAATDVYGATFTMLRGLLTTLGVTPRMVNVTDLAEVESTLKEMKPTCLVVETISNPLLKVADIPTLANLAHSHGAALLVDNTFASPCLFNPLLSGADYAIHSATKYISGHDDVLAGVVATSAANKKVLFELNKLVGSVLGPFEAYLALRGLKTLPLRVEQQFRNAMKVAEWLQSHPRVKKVNYPGLPSHPQHALAEKLFEGKGFGGVLSFELDGAGKSQVYRFMEALTVFLPATTLGDIYSLALHPATSSHRGLTPEERARIGIPDGLVRLSMGIESCDDLLADLEAALAKI
jgi:cystathionine gamma-synthase/methionine-gamma-lyase